MFAQWYKVHTETHDLRKMLESDETSRVEIIRIEHNSDTLLSLKK